MSDFLTELQRRNVFRVGISYSVVAWVIAQAFDLVVDNFGAPAWVMKVLLSILIAGLPVALLLAWAYELTPDGVKKTSDVPIAESVTPRTGRSLNRVTTAALILALAFIAWDKLGPGAVDPQQAITEKSVAVLPFADLSEAHDQEWFADGLTEEILNALARLPELQVTARTSSFEFKHTNIGIGEIADKLGVAQVVEGSVRRIGDDLRVTAQLIRAADGFHLWSKTYESTTEHLFDVQHDVAENIAATLEVILDEDKRTRMFSSGTRDVAAFEAFVKGRDLYLKAHRRNMADSVPLAEANVYLARAMELDPGFARPAIIHADLYAHFLMEGPGSIVGDTGDLTAATAYERMQQDFDFASNNAPDLKSRLIAEINREFFQPYWHRLPALIADLRVLLEQDSKLTEDSVWLDEILRLNGDLDLAKSIGENRTQADPLNPASWIDGVYAQVMYGDYDAALEMIREARGIAGEYSRYQEAEIAMALRRGKRDEAVALLQKLVSAFSDSTYYTEPLLAALQGDVERATQLSRQLEIASQVPLVGLIEVYSILGDQASLSSLVRRIDATTVGPATLAADIVSNGGVLAFNLDDTPNFRDRLAEARIDPARFKTSYMD